jgi:hypothetical protein
VSGKTSILINIVRSKDDDPVIGNIPFEEIKYRYYQETVNPAERYPSPEAPFFPVQYCNRFAAR